jgi:hypothetical protein
MCKTTRFTPSLMQKSQVYQRLGSDQFGGETGIRTLDTLPYT